MSPVIRFGRRLFIFLLTPTLFASVFLLLLPINLFTFRTWETLLPYQLSYDGLFYPNQYLAMTEKGDLALRTEYSVLVGVEFYTDAYGFRYDGSPDDPIDIVIVGDSNILGPSLTQEDTIANQLATRTNSNVYPYAPDSLYRWLQDGRFRDTSPEYVIVAGIERQLIAGFCPDETMEYAPASAPATQLDNLIIRLDMAIRTPYYASLYLSSLDEEEEIVVNERTRMVFYEPSIDPSNVDPQVLTQDLLNCQRLLQERGSRMIFLPIPDRETIFFNDIPDGDRPNISYDERRRGLATVIASTSDAGIVTIDLLTAYEATRDNGIVMYHLDDTHWNSIGVEIAVELILDAMEADRAMNN